MSDRSDPSAAPEPTPDPVAAVDVQRPTRRRKWGRRLKVAAVAAVALLTVIAAVAGTAEYYTSQPNFCGSCHIMDPYYESWRQDVHAGEPYAACVDCHYAPGEQHTWMAKFRGLSQVTSYFSGRAGAGRPKAHVQDASCLRSKCHGDRKFMTAELSLGNVQFSHARHLDPDGKTRYETRRRLAAARDKLAGQLGPEKVAAIEEIGRSMRPPADRVKDLNAWLTNHHLSSVAKEVLAYTELLHLDVRIEQLSGLKCSGCHQFDATLKHHFTAARSSCYTCHFTHESFNSGTGRCLSCHEPPTTRIPVHPQPQSAKTQTAPSHVMMDHSTIVANKVNCISCHADLIHGDGAVTARDCQNCHDQARYLDAFANRTTETVRAYHRVHAGGQNARCNDCHEIITHKLMPVVAAGDSEALFAPVVRNCRYCHPDHHREQIELLLGRGGFVEGASGVPNPMTGSRVNCRACHIEPASDSAQRTVVVGTLKACRECHGDDYKKLFIKSKESIDARYKEVSALLAEARDRMTGAARANKGAAADAKRLIARAEKNARFVAAANGIHNKNYALMLLDQALIDLERALKLLSQ